MRLAELTARVYAGAARARRAWYERHPEARRRLARPVISVGNLAVGGSRKTPVTRHLAGLLRASGERPAILTRGYARDRAADGVVVVSDGTRLRADLARAGDEPLMLAQSLPGVGVFVGADRHLAGRLAERRFGATVHLLDDGFQHFRLERDVDLVLVSAGDLADRPLPAGRLREPIDAARSADALVVHGRTVPTPDDLRAAAGIAQLPVFRLEARAGPARLFETGAEVAPGAGRALVVAGIARPADFRAEMAEAGWELAGDLPFDDHRSFSPADVRAMVAAMRRLKADLLLTTEKDAIRLLRHRPIGVPVAWVYLDVSIEPREPFAAWLAERLARPVGAG